MPTQTQAQLKALKAQIDALSAGNPAPGSDEFKQLEALVGQADGLMVKAQLESKAAKLGEWLDASQGSAVMGSFIRPSLPGEGTGDATMDNEPTDDKGERAMKLFANPDYHGAMDALIRARTVGRAMKGKYQKILQEGVDVAGGSWVLPEFNPYLIAKVPSVTGVYANAKVWNTGNDSISFPKLVYNGAADDTLGGIFSSGMRFAFGPETPNSNYTEATNPIAGRVTIQNYTAVLPVYVTRAMVEDGQFPVIEYVSGKIAEAAMLLKDYYAINGTGAGQPRGLLNAPLLSTVNSSGGMHVVTGVAAGLSWAGVTSGSTGTPSATKGVTGLEAALPPQYENNAKWYANKATYAEIRNLQDAQMRPIWNTGDAYPNFITGTPATLLGYPCVKDQFLSNVGSNAYPLFFGDMTGLYAVERVSMSLQVLQEVAALRDMWVLYARVRFGIDIVEDWRIKAAKCST